MPKTNDDDTLNRIEALLEKLTSELVESNTLARQERARWELQVTTAGKEMSTTTFAAALAAIKQFRPEQQALLLRGTPWVEGLCSELTSLKAAQARAEKLEALDGEA